jgi:DamX protein
MAEDPYINPKLSERFSDLFSVDEFAPESELGEDSYAPYLEESRKLSLNKLLHLAPYSEVLLLLGDAGVGRTTLLNAFVQRAATTWRISFITANARLDGVDFLHQIGAGFELELEGLETVDDLLWELGRYLQALGRSGRRAIIIIDDAHLLTDEVMLLAEKLLRDERTQDSVSLVFSMRRDQGGKLDRFALLKERLAYTIQLEALTKKEVDGYLHHALAGTEAQLDQILKPEVVETILRKSGGLPEQVNTLAHELLLDSRKKSAVKAGGKRSSLVVAAVVLVGILAGVVLFYQDEINRLFEAPPPAAPPKSAAKPPATPELPAEQAKPRLEDEAGQPVEVPLPEEAVTTPVEPAPPAAGTELGKVEQPEVTAPKAITPEEAAATAEPAAKQPAAETAPVAVAETAPQPKPEPKAAPEPEPKPAPPASKPKLSPQMEWLMAQPDDHFTMQLMALVDKGDVLTFVDRHHIGDKSATFPITRRGKVLTVLVYGSYPDRAAADKAARALPKSWGTGEPWVRSFADVHQQLAEQ